MLLTGLDRQRSEQRAPSQLREATVLDPPLTDEGWLRVEVDEQEGAVRECPWTPRADADPEPGFAAVVMESDAGNMWCLGWWPQ